MRYFSLLFIIFCCHSFAEDMVFLKYSNIQDDLYSLSSKGTEETQQRINHFLGVSQEDFAKYGS